MLKKLLFISLICCGSILVKAQSTILESNPPSIKWERIVTPYFNIVFPKGYEEKAQWTANLLETVYEPGALSLGAFPKKTTVILQNQTTISNGFVTWAPYHSEFYTFPSQNYLFVGNNDWLELLSFHEYRHMVQMKKSKVGFTKLVNILFGQATTANMANLAVPKWFWEGDATIMETALTSSGRGRIPGFSLQMRSNFLDKKPFSYNKQYLGSFKEYIPNEYVTGYFFSGYLRKKYGAEIFSDVTKNAWSWSFVPFTFSNSLKKYTGNYLVKNYNQFRNDEREAWEKQIKTLQPEDYSPINKRKKELFTNYSYPHLLPSGKILALKAGLDDISEFIQLDRNGHEEKIVTPGFINNAGRISFNGRQLVWNEYIPDERWLTKVYSDIKYYDLENEKIKKLSKKGRYTSSTISPNGAKILSIVNDLAGNNFLRIIDLKGNTLSEHYQEGNVQFFTPEWAEDSKSFYVIETENRTKRIVQYFDSENMDPVVIYDAGKENISYPKIYGHYLFYQSPFNGIDNIYVINLETQKHYQVTNARYGAYYPYFDRAKSMLYFSDHQENGLNIVHKKIEFDLLREKSTIPVYRDPLASAVTSQESGIIEPSEISDFNFPVEKYPKIKGLINPHSWGVTLGSSINELNLFISSTDNRSTTQINAGYSYNVNEKKGRWEAGISYHGLYPITSLTFTDLRRGFTEEILDTARSYSWDEQGVEVGFTIPWQLTRNKYQKNLILRTKGGFFKVTDFPIYPFNTLDEYLTNGNLNTLKIDVSFNRFLKTSKRDIYSKWGQSLDLFFYSTPFAGDYKGSLFAAEGTFYFPGLGKHHSFYIRPGYQYENKINYIFRSPLLFPRGFTYTSFDHFYKSSFNYTLPLMHPDLGLGPILYIQRVKANLFYDIAKGYRESPYDFITKEKVYRSLGLELNFDTNIMRYKTLFNLGFRINYLPDENSFSYNFLIQNIGF